MYFYQSSNCGCRRIYTYIFSLYIFLYNFGGFIDSKFFLEPLVEISFYPSKVVVANEFRNFLVVCILILYLIQNFYSNDAIISKAVKGN